MPGFTKVHGEAAPGAFYGLQPTVVKVAASGAFTADTVTSGSPYSGNTLVTEGGYGKAVKALETVASIVWLGAQTNNTFVAVVDGTNFNSGSGQTTSGTYGALIDALVSQCGGSAGSYTVTASTALNGDGTFTFA
jgi:hypothetical protein